MRNVHSGNVVVVCGTPNELVLKLDTHVWQELAFTYVSPREFDPRARCDNLIPLVLKRGTIPRVRRPKV